MHPLAVQNKKVLVRAQRRTAVTGSLRSSTLKKGIRMDVGSKYKDEEDGLRSKKRSWEAVNEAAFFCLRAQVLGPWSSVVGDKGIAIAS